MDFYSASGMSLLWICFFETIAVSWFYGVDKFSDNIKQMTGRKPFFFWYLCWKYFAPLLMSVSGLQRWPLIWLSITWTTSNHDLIHFFPHTSQGVFIYYIVSYKPVTYGTYEFPFWAEILGLFISFSSMIWVPAYAIYYLTTQPGTLKEVI